MTAICRHDLKNTFRAVGSLYCDVLAQEQHTMHVRATAIAYQAFCVCAALQPIKLISRQLRICVEVNVAVVLPAAVAVLVSHSRSDTTSSIASGRNRNSSTDGYQWYYL
eukprot:15613-Heterococcus_DN1.PRE.1